MSLGFLLQGHCSFIGNAVWNIILGNSVFIFSFSFWHLMCVPAGSIATINAQLDFENQIKKSFSDVILSK